MKRILILITILVLAFALRFYKLDTIPALNADEAAIGYNAYSLLQTGKDEHGNSWPIHFQSFNDYKPGLYFYIVLPFIQTLGLNEWAVRLPGALAGVGTVVVIYLLVKQLFKNERFATLSALLLAISPWHIHFSRGGWEVNFATFLLTAGLWLFLTAVNNDKLNIKHLILSTVLFVASLYTYHSVRVIVPLLGFGILLVYRKSLLGKNLKRVVFVGLVGLALLLPLATDLAKPAISSRAAGVGLFADTGPRSRVEEQRGQHEIFSSAVPKLIHNKVVNYGLAFLFNWSQHYWGEFLFLSGDIIQRNRVPETGQMYLIELPFVLIGLYKIILEIKDSERKRKWAIIIWWLIIAPFAAALTFQAPHALRAQNMVIPLAIISAYGLVQILDWLNKKVKATKLIAYLVIFILLSLSTLRYLHMYYVHMAKEYTFSSQYGVKDLVGYILEHQEKYKKVMVTDRYDQPYILFLFYTKYSPAKFQAEHQLTGRDGFGFSTVRDFDKYNFSSIKYDQVRPENPNTMIVGTDEEIPNEANIIKNIYGDNGQLYFQVVGN